MAVERSYERFAHSPVYVMGARDRFAALRISKGQVPGVLGQLNFFITRRLAAQVVDYQPPLEFVSWTNPGGFFLFSGEVRTPDKPGTHKLSPGQYRWRVESDYYQAIEFEDVWPPLETYDKNKDLGLLPGPAYPFPDFNSKQRQLGVTLLRGSLLTSGGKPLENVKVELIAPAFPPRFGVFPECTTNKRGDWVIALVDKVPAPPPPPPNDPFAEFDATVRVNLPNNVFVIDTRIKSGQENSLRQTALRGTVVKPGGIPFSGVIITTSVAGGESVSRANGQWFFYFELQQADGPVTVTATSPTGLTQSVQTPIVHGATGVVPAIELS